MNKARCLSLLSNAVLVWNTLRITENQTLRPASALGPEAWMRLMIEASMPA